MRFLSQVLTDRDIENLAAYFVAVLGPPDHRPDFAVSDVWWDPRESGWGMTLRQHSARQQISGSWYTYDSAGRPTWFAFGAGSWTTGFLSRRNDE